MISINEIKFQSYKIVHHCRFASLSLILCLFALCSLLFANTTYAHVLKTDGDIGAVLHVDPDDDPIVGKPTSFFFELKDKTGMFTLSNCTCTLTIKRQGKIESTQGIEIPQSSEKNNIVSTYIFPQKDIYTLILSGIPIKSNDFIPFELHYDIRISREEYSQRIFFADTSLFHNIHYGLFVIGFIILIVLVRKEKQKNN